MKETTFIEQNKDKWKRFEELSESIAKDPEELSNLYMDITDDLSYAQTFYKRRTVRVYLNQLAQGVFTGLHIQKRGSLKKLISVWKTSLPLEVYRARKNLIFALVVFMVWAIIGAITTHFNPNFAKIVLGEHYIYTTNENIAMGNPLAIYETQDQMAMFIDITTNNIRVAFLTFIFGVFFTIGTHFFLFQNGIMLGTFQYFFATKGLFITSFLGIWIHGAFEISSIVLAAGAGITLGNGWLFPKNYSRLQSLQLSAKRGLKIMLSLVPFLIIAGFLESYVTANYQILPEWSKWFLIALSFGIIILYYVIYPIIVARKNSDLIEKEEVVNPSHSTKIDLTKIRTFSEIISDTFRFYRTHFGKFFKINFFLLFPLMCVSIYFQNSNYDFLMQTEHYFDWSKQLEIMTGFGFNNSQDWVVNIYWSFLISGMFLSILYCFESVHEAFSWRSFFLFGKKYLFKIWFGNLLLFFSLSLIPWYWYIFLIFFIPFFYLNGVFYGIFNKKSSKRSSFFSMNIRTYGKSLLSIILFTAIFALFMQPIAFVGSIHESYMSGPAIRDLLDILTDFIKEISLTFGWDRMYLANLTRQIVYLFFLISVLPLWIICMTFIAFNEKEKETANGLKNKFIFFGTRKRFNENETDFN
jgi:uncharacterized membrane protein SpoIIM required for sporulation